MNNDELIELTLKDTDEVNSLIEFCKKTACSYIFNWAKRIGDDVIKYINENNVGFTLERYAFESYKIVSKSWAHPNQY